MNLNSFLNKINDPLAEKTDWNYMTNFSSSTPTHKIKNINHDRLEFVPVQGYQIILTIFSLVGFGLIIYAIDRYKTENWIIILVHGILFFLFSLYILLSTKKAKIFDRKSGYFWIGKPNSKLLMNSESEKIKDMKAIQILVKDVSGDSGWYKSYELNIIKENSNRINILSQGGEEKKFIDLAEKLSAFLQIPLWNTNEEKYT